METATPLSEILATVRKIHPAARLTELPTEKPLVKRLLAALFNLGDFTDAYLTRRLAIEANGNRVELISVDSTEAHTEAQYLHVLARPQDEAPSASEALGELSRIDFVNGEGFAAHQINLDDLSAKLQLALS